jgi:hypothetical protein
LRAAHWAAAYFKAEPRDRRDGHLDDHGVGRRDGRAQYRQLPLGVVEVSVYGSFPHIVTGGRYYPPGEELGPMAGTVTSVLVDLDPMTGRRCTHAVVTGPPSTVPGSQLLFGHAP